MSGDWSGFGAAVGGALARPVVSARLYRHVREASGFLDEDEKLVAPVAMCTSGGRKTLFAGLGIFILTIVTGIFIADRIGEPAGTVLMFGGMGAGLLLAGSALFVTHRHAVALTDRRLLVFRTGHMSGRHIRDVFAAVPRDAVSTGFKSRFGWGSLTIQFAPTTGMTPLQLDFWSVDTAIAEAIHQDLAAAGSVHEAAGQARRPG